MFFIIYQYQYYFSIFHYHYNHHKHHNHTYIDDNATKIIKFWLRGTGQTAVDGEQIIYLFSTFSARIR